MVQETSVSSNEWVQQAYAGLKACSTHALQARVVANTGQRSCILPERNRPPGRRQALISLAIGAALLASALITEPATPPNSSGGAQDQQQVAAKTAPAVPSTARAGSTSTSEPVWFFDATLARGPHLAPKFRTSQMCASGQLDHKTCKIKWAKMLREEMLHVTSEQAWNVSTNSWIRVALRNELPGAPRESFTARWIDSVRNFRFGRWNDDNPFLDDYIGHPMMGAISMYIFIQNDPSGMSLELQNTRQYWMSRLRAVGWATIYSTQWKVGPLSEASVGNQGLVYFYDQDGQKLTNGTGFAGLVTTPVGGLLWSLGEDALDKVLIKRLERVSTNRLWLAGISFLTPSRAFANLMRFKSPWYRDSRPVRGRDAVRPIVVAGPMNHPEQHGTP